MKKIRTYNTYVEAHMALGQLESEGITAFLQDEFTVTIDPVLTNAIGGIKLVVSDEDETKANEILTAFENAKRKNQQCPKCGSENVEYIVPSNTKNWLFSVVSFSLTNMPVNAEKKYHCFDCGFEFDEITNEESDI